MSFSFRAWYASANLRRSDGFVRHHIVGRKDHSRTSIFVFAVSTEKDDVPPTLDYKDSPKVLWRAISRRRS